MDEGREGERKMERQEVRRTATEGRGIERRGRLAGRQAGRQIGRRTKSERLFFATTFAFFLLS